MGKMQKSLSVRLSHIKKITFQSDIRFYAGFKRFLDRLKDKKKFFWEDEIPQKWSFSYH